MEPHPGGAVIDGGDKPEIGRAGRYLIRRAAQIVTPRAVLWIDLPLFVHAKEGREGAGGALDANRQPRR
jgi:hypothetical protein